MPVELKKFNNIISVTLLLLILNNYFLISIGFFNILLKINTIFFFITIIYFYLKNFKNNLALKIYFLLILLICFGTVAGAWDLRSLYLFHAKRIFFDQSLYSAFDNYADFSHNDYPLLLHAFSASFAHLTGYWHEVFPKSAYTFVYLPPLIFLYSYMNNKKYLILLSLLIFFLGPHLFDCRIDGVVALYFTTSAYCFYNIFFLKNNEGYKGTFYFMTFLISSTLPLIKNEGFVLLILIFLVTVFLKFFEKELLVNLKKISTLSLSFTPFVLWKFFCFENGITNTDFTLILLRENLTSRLLDLDNYNLFFDYLFISNEKIIVVLLFFLVSFYLNFNKKLFIYTTLLFFSYSALLLIVYFSTPHDLTYHLHTSASRVTRSLSLMLGIFSLYNLNIYALKESS